MPPDRSVDFDFTKRGLLVFADKSVTAGTPCTSPGPKGSAFTPNLGVNEFNMIIQQMAKVRLSGLVNQTCVHFGAFHTAFFFRVSGSMVPPNQERVEVLRTFPCGR